MKTKVIRTSALCSLILMSQLTMASASTSSTPKATLTDLSQDVEILVIALTARNPTMSERALSERLSENLNTSQSIETLTVPLMALISD